MEAILDVRFTDPAAALYVNVQSDSIESLFAMSTSRVPGMPAPPAAAVPSQAHSAGSSGSAQGRAQKRPREDSAARHRAPAKVVERVEPSTLSRRRPVGPPPMPLHASGAPGLPSLPTRQHPEEPLFLPGSQMSAADREALHASGLGDMDADEFNAMMEDEGEEVGINLEASNLPAPSLQSPPPPPPPAPVPDLDEGGHGQNLDLFEDDIESEMGPTQSDENGKVMCPCVFSCTRAKRFVLIGFVVFWLDTGRRSDHSLTTESRKRILQKKRPRFNSQITRNPVILVRPPFPFLAVLSACKVQKIRLLYHRDVVRTVLSRSSFPHFHSWPSRRTQDGEYQKLSFHTNARDSVPVKRRGGYDNEGYNK